EADDARRELCRALDGLPLAIELAAARTKTLSIEEITRRLDDRFDVLSDPTSRKPERRRALRATIRWRYELLLPDDQRGLGGPIVGMGRGGSRSLVTVDDDDPSRHVRYRLLDSIRAFALEAASEAGLA